MRHLSPSHTSAIARNTWSLLVSGYLQTRCLQSTIVLKALSLKQVLRILRSRRTPSMAEA